jgi:hypothetical protein
MAYRWLLLLQYDESAAAKLKNSKQALGGFKNSLEDTQIRIDNTQHATSAFAKGLRYVFNVKPAVSPN